MHVVIMGCGRVGSTVAMRLDREGHTVTVIDTDSYAFRRLGPEFRGEKLVGSGFDDGTLEAAGTRGAGAFLALTQGDNRNYFASQMAKEVYRVPRVLCRIYDPVREEIFGELGLETFSPTRLGAQIMVDMLLGDAPARR
jgi:trk system potassium uptake protein TrkA